ncbi:class I SAM-dependent methyltransferase [Sinorhizobium meliloti]|uniref:Polyketide synthase protein n=1 Tax=Sinorhizobium meliloti (strain SM11) TaxID=707241 RepID=Q1WLJ8_SINMM|nr:MULTISPECIES: class I SAM-dependent methyltransferase [Sinorhizobium]ABA56002.1 putative polyketide synthase protein [Sinorhizobium meliloti]ARS66111.1 methyltransferase [Sinorhizobium meliloti RU11/001]MBP2471044.1 methyltransferase (TIGR00027 family) [Sinorhizobium meliloti]MDE3787806.1 class I SAM-dependent methyltransferase [Sinorhizobium meliloti]MDE3795694.1 class I SAM-dependent methyltransferase [Sinorhizobium meliloti]
MHPEKIRLTGARETLLITLQAKAAESAMPDSLLRDRFAADALHRLDPDSRHLEIGHDMTIGIALRAYILDRWTEAFLQRFPEGATVLHLGCGLDSRIFRIDPGPRVRWFELDVPDVISLRERVYPDRTGCVTIACSIVERDWIERLPADRPTLIIAEGVLPYLEDDQVSQVLRRIARHFPSGEIAFDAYSSIAIRLLRFNPAIRATGARLQWAVDDPAELERQVPGLQLIEDRSGWDVGQVARMSPPAQMALQLFSTIPYRMGHLLRYGF